MGHFQQIAFLFPGQGTQYVGMGRDFFQQFSIAKKCFEEADDLLGRKLSAITFNGPEALLTETQNSQLAIYVMSLAIWAVVQQEVGPLDPYVCAGLSLGEYTALTAAGYLPFQQGLALVDKRARFMNQACQQTKGAMAAVMGLSGEDVEKAIEALRLPDDIWIANLNCPGQVVISGTQKGVEQAGRVLQEKGAKRIIPLQVYGAFHSGLMRSAQEQLAPFIQEIPWQKGGASVVMNVPGDFVSEKKDIEKNLIKQVTHPVRWEQGIRVMADRGVDLYIEMGCGKTLAGMNKRIGIEGKSCSVSLVDDLATLQHILAKGAQS